MINHFKIKKIIKKKEYRKILDNILSLFSLQGLTYILPLITFPYLTRVLGPDKYGLIAFALAFIGYFQLLTDFGFNLSATREISINLGDDNKISEIFSTVIVTKFILMIISFFILIIIVFSFPKFRNDWLLYVFTFGLVIGNFLLPTWFFQGVQRMRYISMLNIAIMIIYTGLIFTFIRHPSDYIYVPLFNSIGAIAVGIFAIRIISKNFKIKFILPNINEIKFQMEESWHIFISTVAISLYTTSNIFILGFFASPAMVGYYSVATNIMRVVMGLLGPISQSIYPYVSYLAVKSKENAIKFIKKVTIVMGVFTLILSITIFVTAGFIINILAGNQFNSSIQLIRIMSFLPFIVGFSNVFGVLFLFAFGYAKRVSKAQLLIGISYPVLLIPMVYYFKDVGAAFSFVIVEIIITLVFWKIYNNVKNELKI